MSTGMRKYMEKDCPDIPFLPAEVSIDREELRQLREELAQYKNERGELRTKIEQSGPDGFAWPECPKRRQSHVLFDDGYEEGWAACVATIKAAWKSEGQIMCTINNEEPAFPVSTSNPYSGHQDGPNTCQFPGMTLRDYFAAKAMQGLFAAGGGVTRDAGEWASIAYKMADAMLVTRKEK